MPLGPIGILTGASSTYNKGWLFTGGIIADIRNPERVIAIVASYHQEYLFCQLVVLHRGPANSIRVEIYILGFL